MCVCVCGKVWVEVKGLCVCCGTVLRAPKDETNEMSDVKKMNQPHSLKNVMAQKNNGRPAPIVVAAPPRIEMPTPLMASMVFSLRASLVRCCRSE